MNGSDLALKQHVKPLKFDPRTKLLVLLIINIIMIAGNITGNDFWIRIIVALIPAILLLSVGQIRKTLIYLVLFIFASFGEGVVLKYATGNLNLIFLLASGLISRFVPGFMMGYYVVSTTTVSEFIASMERMHVTEKLVIPFSVMFRFFPTIAEENHAISNAMKMRGIGLNGRVKNPITLLEYKLVPIMMSTVKIGDELSAASLTKGLGNKVKRTNMCKIGFKIHDFLLILFAAICFGIFSL